jgi:hypothetical protein
MNQISVHTAVLRWRTAMDNSLTVSGVPVIVIPDERLPIKGYIQNRTHRKKRINKKWRKRYGETPIRDKSAGLVAVGPYGGTA